MEDILTDEQIRALQEFDRFLALDEEKAGEIIRSASAQEKQEPSSEEESEEEEDDSESEEMSEKKGEKKLENYLASRAKKIEEEEREEEEIENIKSETKTESKPEEPKTSKAKSDDQDIRRPSLVDKLAILVAKTKVDGKKSKLHETHLYSLSTQTRSQEKYYVEISEFGVNLLEFQTKAQMRAFPIRSIQRFFSFLLSFT